MVAITVVIGGVGGAVVVIDVVGDGSIVTGGIMIVILIGVETSRSHGTVGSGGARSWWFQLLTVHLLLLLLLLLLRLRRQLQLIMSQGSVRLQITIIIITLR